MGCKVAMSCESKQRRRLEVIQRICLGLLMKLSGGDQHTGEYLLKYAKAKVLRRPWYFEDTIPKVLAGKGQFALILIDCDQYAGTKFCLEYFYGRMSRGGMILIDDYFTPVGQDIVGVKVAVDEFLEDKPEKLEQLALSLYGFRKV